jgi:PAS domain-containing protein
MGPSFVQGLVGGILLASAGWVAVGTILRSRRLFKRRGSLHRPGTDLAERPMAADVEQADGRPIERPIDQATTANVAARGESRFVPVDGRAARNHALAVEGRMGWPIGQAFPEPGSGTDAPARPAGETGRAVLITGWEHAEEALRASDERLRLALEAGRMGTWDWDIRSNRITWSDNLEQIHGIPGGRVRRHLRGLPAADPPGGPRPGRGGDRPMSRGEVGIRGRIPERPGRRLGRLDVGPGQGLR